MSNVLYANTALIPFLGHGHAGAAAWIRMDKAERRRLAMAAARSKDAATLWSLTEAWVRTYTRAGAGISEKTVQGYRVGVQALLAAWTSEDLLHPDPDAAAWYVRDLQQSRLKPGTSGNRLAAARGFYAALRWARASLEDPFRDIHTPRDPVPPWEKRRPYDAEEIAALLQEANDPCDRVLVLLGAHGGLRASECVGLRWSEVSLVRRDLLVRQGKGGTVRTVVMSSSLKQALVVCPRRPDGYVLPYRTAKSAWWHMQRLCEQANVAGKGMHALRHTAGTRLFAETGDLETTARHLGHQRLETTRVYAKWSDRKLRETIGRW